MQDLNDCKPKTLAINLLDHLIAIERKVEKSYPENQHLYEKDAYLSEVLNRYPNLEELLTPELADYRLSQASEEYGKCLRSGQRDRKSRKI